MAAFLAAAVPAAAQGRRGGRPEPPAGPVPRTVDGKPDLRGRWNPGGTGGLAHTNIIEAHSGGFGLLAGKSLIIDPADGIIPYQPWALAERDRRRRPENAYEDPVGHCEFYGVARLHSFALTITSSGNDIIMFPNQHITRSIPMDRREHLPEGIRLWMGDAIGRWEGDTLVVDTTNFNGKTWMGLGGDFHGADAHIVERYTMSDANTLNWQMTITNPKVFTRPWTMTSAAPWRRAKPDPDDEMGDDDSCHEGNADLVHLKNLRDHALKAAGTAK
jgi:hypothetical protein